MLDRELASPASLLPGAPTRFYIREARAGCCPFHFAPVPGSVQNSFQNSGNDSFFTHTPQPQSLYQVSRPGPPALRPESLDLTGLGPSSTEHFLPNVFLCSSSPGGSGSRQSLCYYFCVPSVSLICFFSHRVPLTNPFYQISFVTTPAMISALLTDTPPW